jgi:hypothetical protein
MLRAMWLIVLICARAVTPAHAVTIPGYFENPDAGDRFNPQNLTAGSSITSIFGDIGGRDGEDAFRFFFSGGSLQATFNSTVGARLDLYTDLPSSVFIEPDSAPLFPFRSYTESWTGLVANNYILDIVLQNIETDPPYSVILNGPLTAPLTVPEPSSLALFGLAFSAFGLSRRRKNK